MKISEMSALEILSEMLKKFPEFIDGGEVNGGDLVEFFAYCIDNSPRSFGLTENGYRPEDLKILMERVRKLEDFM